MPWFARPQRRQPRPEAVEAPAAATGRAPGRQVVRGRLLGVALGAAGALLARRPAAVEAGHISRDRLVHLGATNDATHGVTPDGTTSIRSSVEPGSGPRLLFEVVNSSGAALRASAIGSGSGPAIFAERPGPGLGHTIDAFNTTVGPDAHTVFARRAGLGAAVRAEFLAGRGQAVDAFVDESALESHGVRAVHIGWGEGHAVLAQRSGESAGDAVRGGREGAGRGDGVRAIRTGTGIGNALTAANDAGVFQIATDAVAAIRSGDGAGNGVSARRTGSGRGVAVSAFNNATADNAHALEATRAGERSGHGAWIKRQDGGAGAAVRAERMGAGTGAGLHGIAPGDNPAVLAESGRSDAGANATLDGGVALKVLGRALFSTVGRGNVPARGTLAAVADRGITMNSHVSVTLASDPGAVAVRWVETTPGVGFTVHLTGEVLRDTGFSYFIVEPS